MKLEEIENSIENLEIEKVKSLCYKLEDDYSLFLITVLIRRFQSKNELELALLISELLAVKFNFIEGIELLEINFYENVLKKFPDNISFLEGILCFLKPPYTDSLKLKFDYELYISRLSLLCPSSPALSDITEI